MLQRKQVINYLKALVLISTKIGFIFGNAIIGKCD